MHTRHVDPRVAGLLTTLMLSTLGCQSLVATDDPTVHVGETTSLGCVGCHKHDYDTAKSPNHVEAKLPTTCDTCHIKASWSPAAWPHLTWPLVGKHVDATCADCHDAAPNHIPKPPRSCDGCHLSDYQAAKSPNHVDANLPKTCESCHTPKAWKPATWDHSTWPLDGKHLQAACASCHKTAPNRVVKPPRTCDGCHMPDYQGASNPNHVAGSYPKTCQTCHTTSGWKPAGMTNHAFPITSGKHKNVACAKCHVNPDFKVFTCMSSGCHPKGDMDDKHQGEVNGYQYKASACYSCHPDGKD